LLQFFHTARSCGRQGNLRIRKITPDGIISTVAGGGLKDPGQTGLATNANLFFPEGVAVDGAGNIYC
jgi:hypothetical protein